MLQLTNVNTLIYRGTAEALHLACVCFCVLCSALIRSQIRTLIVDSTCDDYQVQAEKQKRNTQCMYLYCEIVLLIFIMCFHPASLHEL